VRAIVDTVSDCIITIDSNANINSFNPAAEYIFGYKQSEVINKNVKMLMPSPFKDKHDSYVSNFVETGIGNIIGSKDAMAIKREGLGERKDGSVFPIEISIGVSNLADGKMFTGVVRDISKQKQIEQLKRNFVSSVSHELRTPLTAIKGSFGLITSNQFNLQINEQAQSLLDITERNISRLSNLINDLLDFKKLESDMLEFKFSPILVSDILEDGVSMNQHYATESKIVLKLADDIISGHVNADNIRIAQVMSNLLSNAAKFSPHGGQVIVGAIRRDRMIRFYVEDKGPGIPEEFRDRIFDRFTQADGSDQKKQGGTGLGMAISKAIIEKHQGVIGFTTELGKGSTFFFDLPILKVS